MSGQRQAVIETLIDHGLLRLDEPVRLASGDMSRWFVDCKKALARGDRLKVAAEAVAEMIAARDVPFHAAGGLTMGADHMAHALAVVTGCEWFSVRKQEKERGTRRRIEGAQLGPGRRVLVVDDVVTRGGSILDALAAVRDAGATVVAATCLVDRGGHGEKLFAAEGIPYCPLATYADLGIPAVGTE